MGEETDIDCGGPNCPSCDLGQNCSENSDCGEPQYADFGDCLSNSTHVCETEGTKTRTVTQFDCGPSEGGEGVCMARDELQMMHCELDTQIDGCPASGWFFTESGVSCCSGHGRICQCNREEYREYACQSQTCQYTVTSTRLDDPMNCSSCTHCDVGSNVCQTGMCTDGACGPGAVQCNPSEFCQTNSDCPGGECKGMQGCVCFM